MFRKYENNRDVKCERIWPRSMPGFWLSKSPPSLGPMSDGASEQVKKFFFTSRKSHGSEDEEHVETLEVYIPEVRIAIIPPKCDISTWSSCISRVLPTPGITQFSNPTINLELRDVKYLSFFFKKYDRI